MNKLNEAIKQIEAKVSYCELQANSVVYNKQLRSNWQYRKSGFEKSLTILKTIKEKDGE